MIKLTLCQQKCCPTVEAVEGVFIIRDDYGGRVSLTPSQLQVLVEKYPELRKEAEGK